MSLEIGKSDHANFHINRVDAGFGDDLRSDESEASYEPLCSYEDVKDFVTFLTYTTAWLCLSTSSSVILFSIVLYKYVFMEHDNPLFYTVIIFCDIIILMEFISVLGFMYYNQTAKKKYVTHRNKAIMILDLVSVVAVPMTLIGTKSQVVFILEIVILSFRNYRVLNLIAVLSRSSGHNTLLFLSFKYCLMSFLIWHVYACFWMSLSCFEWHKNCNPTTSWTMSLKNINEYNSSDQKLLNYISSMLFAINTYTTVGLFGASRANDLEQLLTITLMLLGLYIANGLFIGDFTSVQQESYRRHSIFSYKLNLIYNSLANDTIITKKLKKKVKDFYITFWKKRAAINKSQLFEEMLPMALRSRVLVDKYWDAINASNLLRNTSMPFKRALALQFFSEIYTTGDIIYTQDRVKNVLMFVARGSVQVLSGDDTESSLLTLRMGSCLGDISLIYSLDSQVQVVSTSYSVMFCLRKADLWRTADRLKLLDPSDSVHIVAKRKMRNAKLRHSYKTLEAQESSEILTVYAQNLGLASRLIAQKEAFEDRSIFNNQATLHENTIPNLYIISKEGLKLSDHDGIFIKTTFPWILRPNSQFILIWESFFAIVVSTVIIYYPWTLMNKSEITQADFVFRCLVCLIYTLDFIIRHFTAIEDERTIYTDLQELLPRHFSRYSFIFAAVSAIPFEFTTQHTFLMLNRLFQIYRVVVFIKKTENSFKVNVALIRMIKYVVYLLCVSYAVGVVYYLSACQNQCSPDSWPVLYGLGLDNETTRTDIFETAIITAMLLTSGTGGKIMYRRLIEVFLITMFCVIGTLVFSYLVSDYSATLTLAGMSQSVYIQMVEVIRNFMNEKSMPDGIRKRMDHYLEVQWLHNKGIPIHELLKDAPRYLYEEYQTAKYSALFAKVPLFQELDDDVMNKLTATSKTLFFPPNEFVTYSREIIKEMYIIEKGFCEVISPASGRIEKVIGEGAVFSAIDMVLELPGVFHVRTVTHVSVIKITLACIKNALTPEGKIILQTLVDETKTSFTVQRLFTESTSRMIHKDVEVDDRSWVAPPKRADPRRVEYMNSWKVFRCCRYFMIPYTIMPCGRFLMYYEIFRAVCASISAALLPTSFIYAYYIKEFWIIQAILDLTAYLDIYLRLHVCFYNDKGVLVTHPRATAMHYLGGSFIVDLVACLPVDYFLTFFWKKNFASSAAYEKMCAILRLNRSLQIYRVPDAFSFVSKDIMKSIGTLTLSFELVTLSCALINFLCGIFMVSTFTLTTYTEAIVPEEFGWFTNVTYSTIDMTSPFVMYLISFYFVCSQAIGMGYADMFVRVRSEVILNIILIICGYLWFTYVLVIISNNKSIVNITLTLYQNHMKQLIKFMKREKIAKSLQKKAINHFEYVWQRTHGLNASSILKQCHLALSKDCALHLYEDTLKEVLIFRDMVTSFYRVIGTNLEEQYYLAEYPIIRLNDIVSKIYIVHRGIIMIYGPDGTRYAMLRKGGVFGNIDEVSQTRSMIVAKAATIVDLLVIDTQALYPLIKTYQVVVNRLKKHILLENLSYIESNYDGDDDEALDIYYLAGRKNLPKKLKILSSSYLAVTFMMCSFISFLITTYQAAFKNFSIPFFTIAYFFDIVHIVKIYLGFITPYRDQHWGEIIVAKKKIIKDYLRFNKFVMDLAGSLPTDFLYFAMPQFGLYGITLLRLNRILRLVDVYNYFNIKHDQLNINVLVIKLSSIFISFTLLIHVQGCIWYMLACPFTTGCIKGSWVVQDDKNFCRNAYLCSVYTATSIATYTGFSPPRASTLIEIMYATIAMIFNKFTLAVFIGYMTAIVHNLNATLVEFDHGMEKLKEFLKHSRTSFPLVQKVLTYSSQLWEKSEGMQIPQYLTACPSFLMESIKIDAFGHHIYENEIFMKCHPDFLRMLISLLKVTTLFDGNYVCHQGDVNDTMYFLHQGIVLVYKVNETEEILVDELQELDSFGILQGIVPRTPHTHTFIAKNVTVILSLKFDDWHYLLTFFPASKFLIFDKVQQLWSNV
ncbi:uncharacterized protein [Onthophagus taurus]|uniref:uncharacterized protein isoform X2 n=1 Tax=Onthophagus taurus TaxID=166361 RepID=UPI000C20F0D2|nr:uncharacterized protein LOC111418332 isoform X2 [Onthophagus taurus]